MAIYIDNSRWQASPTQENGYGQIIEYFIDGANDVANLPGTDKIMEASKAVDVSTGDVYILTGTGWIKLP